MTYTVQDLDRAMDTLEQVARWFEANSAPCWPLYEHREAQDLRVAAGHLGTIREEIRR